MVSMRRRFSEPSTARLMLSGRLSLRRPAAIDWPATGVASCHAKLPPSPILETSSAPGFRRPMGVPVMQHQASAGGRSTLL